MDETPQKICPECGTAYAGRSDKKFCSSYCKSSYHYERNKAEERLFKRIDKQLKHNRRLLKAYNKAGKATVRKTTLLADGFNPKYFTHYWKAKNGNLYLFCYEFGFREIPEKTDIKYLLIQHQPYMA